MGEFAVNKAYISNEIDGPTDGDAHRFVYDEGKFIIQTAAFDYGTKTHYWKDIPLEDVEAGYDGQLEAIARLFRMFKEEVAKKQDEEFWEDVELGKC